MNASYFEDVVSVCCQDPGISHIEKSVMLQI